VYTRRGDTGETDTASGKRVTKSSLIMEWEGTLDELISQIGVSKMNAHWDDFNEDLGKVQLDLFHLGEEILTEGRGRRLRNDAVSWMEERISSYLKEAGQIRLFVVPGGSTEAAMLHLSRAVTRRAERRIVELNNAERINPLVLQYLNRLSSLLFFMAILANKRKGIEETVFPWPNPESKREE
jgi:cob(I)alamin adenosyltransferase